MHSSFLIINLTGTGFKQSLGSWSSLESSTSSTLKIGRFAATLGIASVMLGATYFWLKRKFKPKEAKNALNYMTINIVTTEESCNKVVAEIRGKCKVYGAIGFDCEWKSSQQGNRNPVALLQLSTHDGYCGLFRLNQMKSIPQSLKGLLEDINIYKVGVVPRDDAKYLQLDHDLFVNSTLDVRHLANVLGHYPGGLAKLSKNLLNILLDKDWRVICSNWEAENLTERQIAYAAADAHIAIKIFVKLFREYGSSYRKYFSWLWRSGDRKNGDSWSNLCLMYLDIPFRMKNSGVHKIRGGEIEKKMLRKNKNANMMRKTPLYHNCYLQAPDGEVLCTCDYKKAQWYIDKGLAVKVCDDPMTVRLKFEPSGRSVGDVGKYYQSTKENRCVVCGSYDSYIRKNVVPREYRKYLPDIMKEHSSHDVVLLCVRCHKISNARDQAVRRRLAADCDAPLCTQGDNPKYFEDVDSRKIRSAARALLFQSKKNHTLPESRRMELERFLLLHYPHQPGVGLTKELLEEAANIPVVVENSEYESHGVKVVEHFLQNAGLLKLEELWRQHFLDAMQPTFMPPLWSIRHNEERLIVKLNEGRLMREDPIIIGLGLSKSTVLKTRV